MIIVFGAGISGLGAVKLLESKGKEVALIDDKVSKLKTEDGLRFIEEKEIEYIVKSPGISFKSKLITKAIEKNIPIYSEIDIAYEYMDKNIEIIAFTGTNGKTSTATLLFDVFQNLGFSSALISTVEYRIGEEIIPSTHTTPDVVRLNQMLAKAVEKGCEYAFMEVSSHGIHQDRIEGLNFKIAGFTNITHDHLDYHKTFLEYLNVKKRFFDEEARAPWLFNGDTFISYDDEESCREKAEYVVCNGLGGIMFWEYRLDETRTLTEVMRKALDKNYE